MPTWARPCSREDGLYVGTWESDFPGLIFLQAAKILLLGKSIAMFRLFDMVVQLGNAYLIFRIASRLSDRAPQLSSPCVTHRFGTW